MLRIGGSMFAALALPKGSQNAVIAKLVLREGAFKRPFEGLQTQGSASTILHESFVVIGRLEGILLSREPAKPY